MITGIEITRIEPFVGAAPFGTAGAYKRVDGVASGALDPTHPGNHGIALLDKAPHNTDGLVAYRSGFTILTPADPARGSHRLLYEVNNRGRIMLFANLCGGAAGNQPKSCAELGNALPLRRGLTLVWSGWDPAAPAATGLSLQAPVATVRGKPIVQRIREEFIAGTRRGDMATFPLAYEAADQDAQLTMRRTQGDERRPVAFEFIDARTVRLQDGAPPEPGSIYELHYNATNPCVLGIGFAATRDLISHLRYRGADVLDFAPTHALAFGISQAGRYLRDHIAQGFNADENDARVFDGVFTHVAGIGRLFHNTPFGQPFRTRTWHEDHDFPEVAFPFSAAATEDPVTGFSGSLLQGDDSDPKLIETNTATEYWQKGASLLHTDPLGTADLALPENVRGYFLTGTQHAGKAGMPRDDGPCSNPRNWHDPMPAVRALLVALEEWVAEDRMPPDSRLPRIADGTLVPAERVAFPNVPGLVPPRETNDATPLGDWIEPQRGARAWATLVPQVDADGNERAGVRLPDIAVPLGTFTGWNLYREPYPAGELADRDGTFLAFAETRTQRQQSGDARPSLEERYPAAADRTGLLRDYVEALRRDRLLLDDDAEAYLAQ